MGNENEEAKKFSISYVDKNEAMFILGLLRTVPCSHCPAFYKGCKGGSTMQETALMSDRDYIDRHIQGTEAYLCGKLRNIVALSKAEEYELDNKFEEDYNKRISLLTKKGEDNKYVLVHDKDEFDQIIKTIERQMIEKLQNDVDKINRHNSAVINDLKEKIETQNQVIVEMQTVMKKMKRATRAKQE